MTLIDVATDDRHANKLPTVIDAADYDSLFDVDLGLGDEFFHGFETKNRAPATTAAM